MLQWSVKYYESVQHDICAIHTHQWKVCNTFSMLQTVEVGFENMCRHKMLRKARDIATQQEKQPEFLPHKGERSLGCGQSLASCWLIVSPRDPRRTSHRCQSLAVLNTSCKTAVNHV